MGRRKNRSAVRKEGQQTPQRPRPEQVQATAGREVVVRSVGVRPKPSGVQKWLLAAAVLAQVAWTGFLLAMAVWA